MSDLNIANITNNFSISIVGYPNLAYNIVGVSQPGLNIPQTTFYAKDIRIKQPSRSIEPEKGDLQITFNIDENYNNYYEIYNWIKSFKIATNDIMDLMTTINIIHYDLNKKPIRKISCIYCFPISLSELELTTASNTAEPLKFNSGFAVNDIIITTNF